MTAGPDWWGWGDPSQRRPLPDSAISMLHDELGPGNPTPAMALDHVAMAEARPLPDAIVDAVDPGAVLTAHEHRVRRSVGKGYPDLIRSRSGAL